MGFVPLFFLGVYINCLGVYLFAKHMPLFFCSFGGGVLVSLPTLAIHPHDAPSSPHRPHGRLCQHPDRGDPPQGLSFSAPLGRPLPHSLRWLGGGQAFQPRRAGTHLPAFFLSPSQPPPRGGHGSTHLGAPRFFFGPRTPHQPPRARLERGCKPAHLVKPGAFPAIGGWNWRLGIGGGGVG